MKPSSTLLICIAPALVLAPGFCLDCGGTETLNPGWRVGQVPGEGTKPSFDFDAGDRVHIMGMTEENAGIVWHAAADDIGSPWTVTTVANGYFYGPGDLRAAGDGSVHIAFHDHDAQDPRHVRISPGGGFTTYLINTPGNHNGWDNSLAIGPQGNLHQASVNPSAFGALDSLEFGSFDGSSWTFEGDIAGTGSFMYGLNTSLALDGTGRPHILYCSGTGWTTPGNLKYAVKTNGVWAVSDVTTGTGPRGRFPSIAIGGDDRVDAAWLDIDGVDFSHATVMYATLDGGGWKTEPVAELDRVQLGFGDARKSVSLALDSQGVPHIAFSDTGTVRYGTRRSGKWELDTLLEDDTSPYKSLVVLRLDSNDGPGIVFWQPGPETAGRVRFLRRAPPPHALINLEIRLLGGGSLVELEWDTEAGVSYSVERRSDFVSWQVLESGQGDGSRQSYIDPVDADTGSRALYRVRLSSP